MGIALYVIIQGNAFWFTLWKIIKWYLGTVLGWLQGKRDPASAGEDGEDISPGWVTSLWSKVGCTSAEETERK